MVNTRKFTNEEQQILENFLQNDSIYEFINNKICNTEKCRKWVSENSKIKDAIDKNLNTKDKGILNVKDKFLWILSDIINCQLDKKNNSLQKQISTALDFENLLTLLGFYGQIEGVKRVIDINFIEDHRYLEEMARTYLESYSLQKKNFMPSNRLIPVLEKIYKIYSDIFLPFQNDLNENNLTENMNDLILYMEGKKSTIFEELEEETYSKRSIKRKYEDEYSDEDNLLCLGESISSSDEE